MILALRSADLNRFFNTFDIFINYHCTGVLHEKVKQDFVVLHLTKKIKVHLLLFLNPLKSNIFFDVNNVLRNFIYRFSLYQNAFHVAHQPLVLWEFAFMLAI